MPYELPALPYPYNALEPHIDAQTMEIHHTKHHAAYVSNVNKALEGQAALQNKAVEELLSDLNAVPESIRMAVRNNGGGHSNHSMLWLSMGPRAGGAAQASRRLRQQCEQGPRGTSSTPEQGRGGAAF